MIVPMGFIPLKNKIKAIVRRYFNSQSSTFNPRSFLIRFNRIILMAIGLAVFASSLLCSFASVAGDNNNPGTSGQQQSIGPQAPPNIVLQSDPQTQATIGKLFDNKAAYQYFHQYEKNVLFKIPTK